MDAPVPPAGWPAPIFVALGLVALGLVLGLAAGLLLARRSSLPPVAADEIRRVGERRAVTLLRGRRHDFLNHLQVISGWLQLGNFERAGAYVCRIQEEMEREGRFIRAADPSLVTFLLAKEEEARSRGLELQSSIEAGLAAAEEIAATIQPTLEPVLDRIIEASPPSGGWMSLDLSGDGETYSAAIEGPDDAERWMGDALGATDAADPAATLRVRQVDPRRWVITWPRRARRRP